MKGFFQKLDDIDSIIAGGSSKNSAQKLANLMTEAASAHYVFEHLDPTWLECFEEIDYFRALSFENGKKDQWRHWSASAYLKRIAMAETDSHKFAHTLYRIVSFLPDPDNLYSFRDLVEIASRLPSPMKRDIVPVIQRALSKNFPIEYANVGQLIEALAQDGETSSALRLFSAMFSVFNIEPTKMSRSSRFLPRNATALMNSWHYREEMNKCVPTLARLGGIRFLSHLCNLLAEYTRITQSSSRFQGPDDYSYIWRPAIEDNNQNSHDDIRDTLITAIRDCAEKVASEEPEGFHTVIRLLEAQQWFVFTRILLHLLGTSPGAPVGLIRNYATQPYLFSEVAVRHEYSLLLKQHFKTLLPEQQAEVLKLIDNGPDSVSFVRRLTQRHGNPPSDDVTTSFIEHWKLDWLSFIQQDLSGEWKNYFLLLQQQYGDPAHPELPYFVAPGSGSSGPAELTDKDSYQSIGNWIDGLRSRIVPTAPHQSVDGGAALDGSLRRLVIAHPEEVVERVTDVSNLPPRYLTEVIGALITIAVNADQAVLETWLTLSVKLSIFLQEDEYASSKRLIQESLTSSLSQILENPYKKFMSEHLAQIQQLSSRLLRSVQLAEGETRLRSENFDPLLTALNVTNGRIIETSMLVALRQKQEGNSEVETNQWLFEDLSRLLSLSSPDEVVLTSLLGYRFPWLVYLSRIWTEKNAEKVFPRSEELRVRWEAAWGTYVSHSGAYDDAFAVLSKQYSDAAHDLSRKWLFKKSRLRPGEGLAQHLAIYYWRQKLNLDDPIFLTFMERGDGKAVAAFISYIGRGLGEVKGMPGAVAASLLQLVEWIFSEWRPRRNAIHALSAFGWWFPYKGLGDSQWRLQLLGRAAKRAPNLANINVVLKELESLASEYPSDVVNCLGLIVKGTSTESDGYFLAEGSVGILDKAQSNASAVLRNKISQIADRFGSLGYFQYRRFAQTDSVGIKSSSGKAT